MILYLMTVVKFKGNVCKLNNEIILKVLQKYILNNLNILP